MHSMRVKGAAARLVLWLAIFAMALSRFLRLFSFSQQQVCLQKDSESHCTATSLRLVRLRYRHYTGDGPSSSTRSQVSCAVLCSVV